MAKISTSKQDNIAKSLDEVLAVIQGQPDQSIVKSDFLHSTPISEEFPNSRLSKSSTRPHKYLRKYQRHGQWIYVYHEGEQHGRRIPEEAIHRLKELADLGDEHAKRLHDSLEAHSEGKLKLLRENADLGDTHAESHLAHLGINRAKERVEDEVHARESQDPIDKELSASDKRAFLEKLKEGLNTAVFGHLAGHASSPYHTTLTSRGITLDGVMEAVGKKTTKKGILAELHKQMKKVDDAHATAPGGITGTQNRDARDAGGYGSHGYNSAVKNLQKHGHLPVGYNEIHTRKPEHNQKPFEAPPIKELQERQERVRAERADRERREKAEREERERRELAEVHGSMAHHMSSLVERGLPIDEIKKLNRTFKAMYGKTLSKEDWPYNFEAQGLKVKISSISIGSNSVSMHFIVHDAEGNLVTDDWQRNWDVVNGKPHIYNARMFAARQGRGSARLGILVNQAQQKFMRRHAPDTGTVTGGWVDVGCYNWANCGFSFSSGELSRFRELFKSFMRARGHEITDADLQHFTEPCHFAGFHDGKFTERSSDTMRLTPRQIETRSLDGTGQIPLTAEEIRAGKVSRVAEHAGKKFMLGKSWHGLWEARRSDPATNQAQRFCDNYQQLKTDSWKQMDSEYKRVVERVASIPPRLTVDSRTAPINPASRSTAPPPPSTQAVRRPRAFRTWSSQRQEEWYERNRNTMNSTQRQAARRLMNATRSEEDRRRRSGGS